MDDYRHVEIRKEYKDLMDDANALATKIRSLQTELVPIVKELNKLALTFEHAREAHFNGAVDEHDSARSGKSTKQIKYNATPTERGQIVSSEPTITPVARVLPVDLRGKRACSLCRNKDPRTGETVKGHRAQNCPYAHIFKGKK